MEATAPTEVAKTPSKDPFKHYSICSWRDPDDTRRIPEELCDFKGLLKLLQKKKPKGPPAGTYCLKLKCKSRGSTSRPDLVCATLPETLRDLKTKIEEECSVPACMQEITHKSTALTDDNMQLKKAGIKPGTFIEVSYECEAEVHKVGRIVEWINYMTHFLENMHPVVSTEIGTEADMLAAIGLNERMCERLALNYFSPGGVPRVEANKRYFLSKKGPSKLSNLLYIIISQPWGQQFLRLKLLEGKILDALRCFGQGNKELQKVLVGEEVVGYALMMLHRVRLVAGQPVEDRMGSWGAREHNNFLVVEMLGSVIELLWLFQTSQDLFSDMAVMDTTVDQLLLLVQSSSISHRHCMMALFLVIARIAAKESTKDVGNASKVALDIPSIREGFGEKGTELMMTRYCCALLVSLFMLHTCEQLRDNGDQISRTLKLMKDFIASADLAAITDLSHTYKLFYTNVASMFTLLFHPKNQPHTLLPSCTLSMVTDLEEQATQVLLFHLQVVFSFAPVRESLEGNDTAEYLVCLPWSLPPSAALAAQKLVAQLHGYKPLPLPRLSHMVRSMITHTYLDYKKVLKKAEETKLSQAAQPDSPPLYLPVYTSPDRSIVVISLQ